MVSTGGRWFRVNTTWSQSEWLAELSPASRLAWIELLGYVKAHGYDGRVRAASPLVFGRSVGIDAADVVALLEAAAADGALRIEDGEWIITGWTRHQGDPTGAQRVKKHRERNGRSEDVTDVTRYDRVVTATETETETETETHSSILRLHVREESDAAANAIICLANRGMGENPEIGTAYNPIPIGHGSRETVLDWLRDGIPAELAGSVVHERAKEYQPDGRRRQITTMRYFDGAVRDAHDQATAKTTALPPARRRAEKQPADTQEYTPRPYLGLNG